MNNKVLIAMSGGVDSSVAAAKMKESGYECTGMTMKLYDGDNRGVYENGMIRSSDDIKDAGSVCDRLGIKFYVSDFRNEFNRVVMCGFMDSYRMGQTPNPCVECNRNFKFGEFMSKASELGCDHIVTGHYAKVVKNENTGLFELHCGLDRAKDQSYFLYMLTQEQLSHVFFPIGDMCKEETRAIAEKYGFVNAHKSDSQDICFIPDGDCRKFLKEHDVVCPAGNFVDEEGNVLGRHTGICNYTIGQRKGLGIAFGTPLYVKEIRPEDDTVVLSDNESLFSDTLRACKVSWTLGSAPADTFRCSAKIRYRHREAPATVRVSGKDEIEVVFDEKQRAITKGQAVVLYDGELVLGGGTII